MSKGTLNKVTLIGNLGADPDVRYFPDGNALANVSLATSESWKDRNTGEPQERTEWHRVVIRGKLAEVAKQYLRKGSKIYVEGRLQTRKWQAQDGQERYTTEVVVGGIGSTMLMLDSRGGGSAPFSDEPGGSAPAPSGSSSTGASTGGGADFDDDIPF